MENRIKVRESNFELLRIVAMFLVIIAHVTFAFTIPTFEMITAKPISSWSLNFFSDLSLGSIHLFVLISGYFGIRIKLKSLLSLLFQVVFYLIIIYFAVMLIRGEGDVKLFIKTCLPINGTNGNWFIAAYLGLMLLSPILNKWLEHISLKDLRNYLIAFYLVVFVWGWIFINPFLGFNRGYSTMAFIGLYCLGHYLRLLSENGKLKRSKYFYLMISLSLCAFSALFLTLFSFFTKEVLTMQGNNVLVHWTSHVYPIRIMFVTSLFILFSKISLRSRFVNWISSSVLSVYLVHRNEDIYWPYFREFVRWINANFEQTTAVLYISLFIILVFIACILFDQVRIYIWNRVWNFGQRLTHK